MRPSIPILLAALVCAPTVLADASLIVADPRGDVVFTPRWIDVVCSAPAVDVTELAVASDGTTLSASLTVVDADAPTTCAGLEAPEAQGRLYVVDFQSPCEEASCTRHFSLIVRIRPEATTLCQSTQTRTASVVACVDGPAPLSGSTFAWTLPLAGTVDNGTRSLAYDLTTPGFTVEATAWELRTASLLDASDRTRGVPFEA